jgi:DNA repair exonuclease SbcCD ATPase subunit
VIVDINGIQRVVVQKLAEHKVLSNQIDQITKECKSAENKISNMVEARNIIAEASRVTQEQYKEFVESLITLAIQSVFPEKDYKFIVDFVLQANTSQIFLMVQQGDKEPYLPKDEQGGCLLDIISFALRIVLWSLEKPRSRNVLIFDEPFRWTGALTERAANMMKEISGKLGIQIIMVTHDERLSEVADRSWHVARDKNGVSVLSLLN